MERSPAVTFRGTQDGVLLRVDGSKGYREIRRQLEEHISSSESFFRGAELLLEVGEGALTGEQLLDLERLVARRCGATLAGAATLPRDGEVPYAFTVTAGGREAGPRQNLVGERMSGLLVRGTVRSGQRVRHHGHLLLIGDVNPGGEVLAGADILIFGRLRGMAHAGATGRRGAVIAACRLEATQLRIAEYVTRSPDGDCGPAAHPEVARVDGDRIVLEPYHSFLEREGISRTAPVNGRDASWASPSL